MNTSPRDPHPLLTVLWIFLVLNILARDSHGPCRPGMLEQLMPGVIDGVETTEALMLPGGAMVEIPILMAVQLIAPVTITRAAWCCSGDQSADAPARAR